MGGMCEKSVILTLFRRILRILNNSMGILFLNETMPVDDVLGGQHKPTSVVLVEGHLFVLVEGHLLSVILVEGHLFD